MTSQLKASIDHDFVAAMKAKETRKKDTLVMLRSAIKQREVDQRITLTDLDVLEILSAQIKQRHVSLEQFRAASRDDLADQEQFEIDVLTTYLPQALTSEEIDAAVTEAISQLDAKTIKDMGKVMARLKPGMQGRADLGKVSQLIKQRLTAS
jgi:uncharacterized protein